MIHKEIFRGIITLATGDKVYTIVERHLDKKGLTVFLYEPLNKHKSVVEQSDDGLRELILEALVEHQYYEAGCRKRHEEKEGPRPIKDALIQQQHLPKILFSASCIHNIPYRIVLSSQRQLVIERIERDAMGEERWVTILQPTPLICSNHEKERKEETS